MKFKFLKLINFQAHKELLVKFSPGITTIVGPTDAGKSAILRALGWVCLNNISGDGFITEGEKKTTVILKTDEHRITRERSVSGVNSYRLDDAELKAFGSAVPDQIASHLALSPLNFQSQHDPPFWFSETAGEVSRQLNAIIDLSVIDSSLAYVGSLVRENTTAEKLCKERLEKVTAELEELGKQRERIKEFERLEKLKEFADKREAGVDELGGLLSTIDSNQAKKLTEKSEDAHTVLVKAKGARVARQWTDFLVEAVNKIEEAQEQSKPPPDFVPVEKGWKEYQELEYQTAELRIQINDVTRALERLNQADSRLIDAETAFHENAKNQKCPLCGNLIE